MIDIFSIMSQMTFGPACQGILHAKFDQHVVEEFQSPICALDPTDTIETFIKIDQQKRIYRALVNQPKTFIGERAHFKIISQTDVMKYLVNHADELGNIVNQTVEQLNLYDPHEYKQVLYVKTNESAFQGFQRIQEADINGIAVIDELTGKLVGNLSASDLRGLSSISLIRVMDSVKNFLGEKLYKPITCSSQSSLLEIMRKCVDAKVHRIYVVDAQQFPKAVITFSDILRKFIGDDNVMTS